MGPGHLGVAFAVKPLVPKAPLWTLLVASETLDLLCGAFVAIGMEKISITQTDIVHGVQTITPGSVPWSHGLFMSLVWSVLAGAIAHLLLRDRRASGMIGFVVFSHWILDFMVHPPDLPVFFSGSPVLGLGLWTSGFGLILSGILEIVLLGGGVVIYIANRGQRITLEHK